MKFPKLILKSKSNDFTVLQMLNTPKSSSKMDVITVLATFLKSPGQSLRALGPPKLFELKKKNYWTHESFIPAINYIETG